MGFGSGSWFGFIAVAALIALAAAGGEIILVPLALVAVVAAAVWYVFFRALGAERPRGPGGSIVQGAQTRSAEAVERELHVNRLDGELPGGAEGGDDSPSAHRIALPAHDGTPWGDTDQHSAGARMPAGSAGGR